VHTILIITFAPLLAALIAAVAIAVAARRFAERHLDGCAVMRAMGVSPEPVFCRRSSVTDA
jgi:predicted lysophospholipase L1 biosynthesis ABC-type transport system permease subunit